MEHEDASAAARLTLERPGWRRHALPLGIITLFFVFSVAVAWQLVMLNGQLRNHEGENTLWALTQAQTHGSKLQLMDEQFRQGMIGREALVLQEDVFFSRLSLLDDGPQQRLLAHFGQDGAVMSAVDRFRAADTGSIGDLPRNSPVHDNLAELIGVLAAAANAVMVTEREERSQQFDRFARLIHVAFMAFSVVILTGGLLVWQLLQSQSYQRRQLRVIAEQRDALQQTVHELHEAQQATETYRNFVSLVSHQFRTPLAVIDSTAQRLMRNARDEANSGFADSQQVVEKMNLTRSTIEHLNKLIDSVLTSVRLDSGAIQMQSQRVNLSVLIGQVVGANAHLLQDRPLLLETSGEADAYSCLGDAVLLEHVLQNMLSNACKYTHPGTAIAVTLSRSGYGTIVCTVRDWGEGVAEAELPYIFERFYRSGQSRAIEGTGLGLYLARSIVRLHGGNMDASLPEGGGLAVSLRIPAEHMKPPPVF